MDFFFVETIPADSSSSADSPRSREALNTEQRSYIAKATHAKKRWKKLQALRTKFPLRDGHPQPQAAKMAIPRLTRSGTSRSRSTGPSPKPSVNVHPRLLEYKRLIRLFDASVSVNDPIFTQCGHGRIVDMSTEQSRDFISCCQHRRDWQDWSEWLGDEGTAMALVADWAVIQARVTKLAQPLVSPVTSLELRSNCSALLRERLDTTRPEKDRATLVHLYLLFKAEVSAGGYDAAAIHAAYLAHVVRLAHENNFVDRSLLSAILRTNVNLAVVRMQNTSTQNDGWYSKALITSRMEMDIQSEQKDLSVDPLYQLLDASIEIDALRTTFIEARQQIMIAQRSFTGCRLEDGTEEERVFTNLQNANSISLGRLHNLQIDLIRNDTPDYQSMTLVGRHVQTCLSLALMMVLQFLEHACLTSNLDMTDTMTAIATRMQWALGVAFENMESEEQTLHHRALIWISMVGTIYEHWAQPPAGQERAPEQNFTDVLLRLTHIYDIHSSTQLETLAADFVYTKALIPNNTPNWDHLLHQPPHNLEL